MRELEPEVSVTAKDNEKTEAGTGKTAKGGDDSAKWDIIRLASGAAVYGAALGVSRFFALPPYVELALFLSAYAILGGDVVLKALKNITKGRVFDENFLMGVATIGAFIIGEIPEAVAVMLFYQVGEFFQSAVVRRSKKSIADLMDIRPDSATVKRSGELVTVAPETVAIGEPIVVRPGERIPPAKTPVQKYTWRLITATPGASLFPMR